MITEDYVSFETAKLLKEKGFEGYSIFTIYDENAANAYIKELQEKHLPYSSDDPKLKEFYYTQSTLQMAMKWLREEHNIYISIQPDFPSDKDYKMYWCWSVSILCENCISTKGYQCYIDSFEEAVEGAIKYCLENLI